MKTGIKSKTDGMVIEAIPLALESNWQQMLVSERSTREKSFGQLQAH